MEYDSLDFAEFLFLTEDFEEIKLAPSYSYSSMDKTIGILVSVFGGLFITLFIVLLAISN